PASWQKTGRTFEGAKPPVEVETESAHVAPGTEYSTAIDGNGLPFVGAGWWEAERDFTWSRGERSELNLRFAGKLAGDVVVTLEMMPYLGRGYMDSQRVIVKHEGNVVGDFEMERYGHRSVTLSLGTEGAETVSLVVEVPGAISPATALSGMDQRTL